MQKLLIIDGNYFAHRVLGQLNMGDSINNIETPIEINNFKATLNSSLMNLHNTFNNDYKKLIDNIIFVVDYSSWRKEIIPHKPYYINDGTPLGYKDNRAELKEKSTINYDNFNEIYYEFTERIKTVVNVFKIHGLEGDDNMLLLSNKFKDNPEIECIVFCNDGDMNQTVKDNFMLFRNIKSKEAPEGEFIITLNKFKKIFCEDSNVKNAFLTSSVDKNYYKELFQTKIGTNNNIKVDRKLNAGIDIANPFTTAMVKSICGDKKDNIFPILRWKSTTGTKNFKVTENHIDKVTKKLFKLDLSERTCQQLYSNSPMLTEFIKGLIIETKQSSFVTFDNIMEHLTHNMRINILSVKNVPENYVKDFDSYFDDIKDKLMKQIDLSEFRKLQISLKDNATEIYADSIPDINQILK